MSIGSGPWGSGLATEKVALGRSGVFFSPTLRFDDDDDGDGDEDEGR